MYSNMVFELKPIRKISDACHYIGIRLSWNQLNKQIYESEEDQMMIEILLNSKNHLMISKMALDIWHVFCKRDIGK